LKHLFAPSAEQVQVVKVPKFNFVMVDGKIEPGQEPATSPEFQEAMEALYGVSFTLKFMSKLRKTNPIDYTVMALEGLWWVESSEFDFNKKEDWHWTLMMMQPKHITVKMYQESLQKLREKRDSSALPRLRFESFQEGLCIQIMHVGPYSEEPRTMGRMKAFAEEHGYMYRGKHHEIYMGDPRRAKPEKLRTILRQPVQKPKKDIPAGPIAQMDTSCGATQKGQSALDHPLFRNLYSDCLILW
jgi:hypothetical protein